MTLPIKMHTDWYKPFLAHLSESANIRDACAAAGVSRQAAYLARQDDSEFAQAWTEALADAVDTLKKLVWKWACKGDFPDTRAMARWLISIHDPAYRDAPAVQVNTNVDARTKTLELGGVVTAKALAEALILLAEVKALPGNVNGHTGAGPAEAS